MNKISDILLSVLFEKLPFLNLLNGYKTQIGQAIEFIGALLALLQHSFPNLPYLALINGWFVMVSGIVVKYIGVAHADSKERRGL